MQTDHPADVIQANEMLWQYGDEKNKNFGEWCEETT